MRRRAVVIALAIGACAQPGGPRAASAPVPGINVPPGRIGDYPAPGRDSIMTSGPYAGAPARLVCDKNAPEIGEFVTCSMSARIMGPRGPIEVALPRPDSLHATTPDIVAFTTKGQGELVAKNPGWTVMWARVYGAVVSRPISVARRFGSLHLVPNVRDTVLHVGDTLLLRVLVVNDTGTTMPVRRGEVKFNEAQWGAPGRFEEIDSLRGRFIANGIGRSELHVVYGPRAVNLTIKVDSAPHRVIAVRHPIVTVIASGAGGATRPARVGLMLLPDSTVAFTDSLGMARFTGVSSGSHTVVATCPVSRRLIGREFARETFDVESRNDRSAVVNMNATECVEPTVVTARGTFAGHYSTGMDGETFQPCKYFPAPNGDAYDLREQLAWVALSDTTARDSRLVKVTGSAPGDAPALLYVRWTGTLTGPGSYGIGGRASYLLHVERILEVRRAAPRDCER